MPDTINNDFFYNNTDRTHDVSLKIEPEKIGDGKSKVQIE